MKTVHFVLPDYESNWRVSLAGSAPPTGPTYLYSFAKANNFGNYDKGKCWDLSIHDSKTILESIGDNDLVCLTLTVSNYENTIRFAKLIRKRRKRSKIAIGGPWASVKSNQIQKNRNCFDYIVCGEGESILLKLLYNELERGIYKSKVDICSLSSLDFLGWTEEDLKRFQDNYINMLETRRYGLVPKEIPFFVFYQSARGCTQKPRCGFCGSRLGSQYTFRTASQYVQDIEAIIRQVSKINPKIHIFDCSDTFNVSAEGLPNHSFEGVEFTVYQRADDITVETASKLRRLGVTKVSIGFETGSETVMREIGKGIQIPKHYEAVRLLRDNGIKCYANLLYGCPNETLDDLKRTVDHFSELTEVGDFYRVAGRIVTPLPNARWYFQLLKKIKDRNLERNIQEADTINIKLIQDLWLKEITSLNLEMIAKEHEKIIVIAREKGISFSSEYARGIQ